MSSRRSSESSFFPYFCCGMMFVGECRCARSGAGMISSWNYIVELRFAFCDRLEGKKKKIIKKKITIKTVSRKVWKVNNIQCFDVSRDVKIFIINYLNY